MIWPWVLLAAAALILGAAALLRGVEKAKAAPRRCPHHIRPLDNGLGYPTWPHPARCEGTYGHDGWCHSVSIDHRWWVRWQHDKPWKAEVRRTIPGDIL